MATTTSAPEIEAAVEGLALNTERSLLLACLEQHASRLASENKQLRETNACLIKERDAQRRTIDAKEARLSAAYASIDGSMKLLRSQVRSRAPLRDPDHASPRTDAPLPR